MPATDGPDAILDLSDPRDAKAFERLEAAFAGWSNELAESGLEYRSPKNRREARQTRQVLEQAKRLEAPSPMIAKRIEELEAVLDAIPGIRWRTFVVPMILACVPVVYLWSQKSQSDELTRLSADLGAQTWTLVEDAPLYRGSFTKETEKESRLGVFKRGTTMSPISRSGYFLYQVKLATGEIGYVESASIGEGRKLVAREDARFFTVYPFKKDAFFPRSDLRGDEVRLLPAGTEATFLEMLPSSSGYKVRLSNGDAGWVLSGEMVPAIADQVPVRRNQYARIYTLDRIRELTSGKSVPEVIQALGTPRSLVYDDPAKGIGRASYDRQLVAVVGNRRHDDVVLLLEGHKVVGQEIGRESRSAWVEALPLAGLMRDEVDLNGSFVQEWEFDPPRPLTWWGRMKGESWLWKILFGVIGGVAALGLLMFFPWLASVTVRFPLPFIRPLPNVAVVAIAMAVLFVTTYVYFLVFTLFVSPHEGVTLIVAYDIFTVLVWITFLGAVKVVGRSTRYHRCSQCRQMDCAIGIGTQFTGSTRSINWRARDVYKGKSESRSGDNVTITHHYDRHWDKVITTRSNYLDHRECAFCHHTWAVSRTEIATETARG